MTTLAKKVRRGTQGHRMGRPIEMPGAWGKLARAVGSSEEVAAILGVTLRTLNRWASGQITPHALRQPAIADLFARHGLKSPV